MDEFENYMTHQFQIIETKYDRLSNKEVYKKTKRDFFDQPEI